MYKKSTRNKKQKNTRSYQQYKIQRQIDSSSSPGKSVFTLPEKYREFIYLCATNKKQTMAREPSDYIHDRIEEGEHQQQDFKFEISDARKIARSLSAFANTDGGRLLVGVKDNGKIAGVRSEEEIYMVEAATSLYCKPQIECEMHTYRIEGRTVLEVIIPEGKQKPYYAKDHDNHWWAYVRVKDENILATPVHLKVWQQSGTPLGSLVRYTESEQILLDHLAHHDTISLNQYCRLARVSRPKAETILARFIRFDLIEAFFGGNKFLFKEKK